jgi:hypothetical protein
MSMTAENARMWFLRVMWIGILANFALAIPTIVAPARMIAFSNLPPADPLLWPRFAGLLLVLLSIFYMPAANDPDRYRTTAWTAVGSRLAGVLFFLTQPRTYLMLGMFDLVFLVPEFFLLLQVARTTPRSPGRGAWQPGAAA